jgi:RND family efflux transporter MFP subunit
LKGAQVDLARYQGLAAQNAVPHQTLDTQIALVATDQGTVEADRGLVKAAEVNLAYTKIVSPLDGRVGLRQVDQGNYVTPGDTNGLVVITQLKPISVLFTIPEDNLQAISKRLQNGASLPTTALNRSGTTTLATGTLTTFDSQIDPTTGTIKLRAEFPNENEQLYPNQFVNIRLLLDTHKDVVTMSTSGIQRGVPGTFVYLVQDDSTVTVRPVKLGITDGDRVEVLSGVQPGDRIVMAPTSCAKGPRSSSAPRVTPITHRRLPVARAATRQVAAARGDVPTARPNRARNPSRTNPSRTDRSRASQNNEPVTAVYSTAGGDHAADDRHHALGHAGVPLPPRRGPA